MDGDNFVKFKANVGRRFARVTACLKEHDDRLDVAEDRLDAHEQNLADLKAATEALARIDARAAERAAKRDASRARKRPRDR
jgi:hypothetical protein